jgi:predicted RNA-binding protein YlxR (DUF448 family)
MCVACRTSRPKRELQRVVRTPERDVVFDPTGRLAGRGAYVCQGSACLELAIKKGALSRALATSLPAAFLEAVTAGALTPNTTQGDARGQE